MNNRMWTYPELRYIIVNRFKLTPQELTLQVNREFHGGMQVRSISDIEKIKRGKTIFSKDEPSWQI